MKEITVNITANIKPQKIKKLDEALFSSPVFKCVVFKSFLVAMQIIPTLIKLHIPITASVFNGDMICIIPIPVNKIDASEVIEQNRTLERTTFFGLIGKVLRRLKNFPSRDILFAQNEFNKIEYISTEHKTISKSQLSIVNSRIIDVKMFAVVITIRGKDSTIAK